MLGDASDMYAEIDGARIPLAGIWTFQPGPDLSELPEPPALAAFKTPFPQEPSILFKAMIAPLTRFNIKGAIWYQGEDNVGRARQYRALFPSLIRDWRTQWGTELPFLFVQLAGYGSDPEEPADSPWAELREAQASALRLPRTGMATAIDVGDVADIHPRNKQAVAQRLALAAAKVAYHTAVIHSGPTYREMRIEGAAVRLTFSYRGTGLCVGDASDMLRGFAIAGTDGRFVWAQARLDGLDVIVWSDTVLHPVTVRYDWANTPNGNLYNREGLPAVPFRTDTDTR
jgi:sialate O-acetylesterase